MRKATARSVPEVVSGEDVTTARRARMREVRLSLGLLRDAVGKTQTEVAAESGMSQAEVSRVEHRKDVLLSTLRRYLGAVGADLEVVAVFPKTGHRIRVDI